MNPRALDLVIRSVTTALLAFGVLAIAAYEVVKTGHVEEGVGAFVGLVLGFYFGAHTSQNGASARSRAEALAVESATGQPAPLDPLARVKAPETK